MKRANVYLILLLQVIMNVTVVLSISPARQILGFIFLFFIPGYLLLRILKLDKLRNVEKISFSVGLSLAFVMFIGLFVNEVTLSLGGSAPLSVTSLVFIVNLFSIPLYCLAFLRGESFAATSTKNVKLAYKFLPFASIPLLTIVGSLKVRSNEGNLVLLLMIIAFSILIALASLSRRIIPSTFYPVVLYTICLALLLAPRLVTSHIGGYDNQGEFYTFMLTQTDFKWNSSIPNLSTNLAKTNAMISVTILPTIYSQFSGINEEMIFKVIFPTLFSFVSLTAYLLYCTQCHKRSALLASFFLITNSVVFTLGPNKQRVAEVFYSLLLLVLFTKRLSQIQKRVLFAVFSAALVISHYSVSYIFLFSLIIVWVLLLISRQLSKKITVSLILLFLTLNFSWYIYISRAAPFTDFLTNINEVVTVTYSDFFNPASRGEQVEEAVGLSPPPTVIHQIGRLFFWLSWLLMIIGFLHLLILMIQRKKTKFDKEYVLFTLPNMIMLIANLILPGFANTFRAGRFFNIGLIILAPMCVLGGQIILNQVPKFNKKNFAFIFSLTLLIPLFLFKTGFVYEIAKVDSWSVPLSMYRMPSLRVYGKVNYEVDVKGAVWLHTQVNYNNAVVFADPIAQTHVLTSYGMNPTSYTGLLSNRTGPQSDDSLIDKQTFVFLGRVNVAEGIIVLGPANLLNTTDIRYVLQNLHKVYSNGDCIIYAG